MTAILVLDVDPGVDDTMALLYALLHPDVEVLAVGAVWGNADVDTTTRNSLHAVAMAGRPDIPVAKGAAGPLDGRPPVFAPHVHGADGQGNRGNHTFSGAPAAMTAAEQIIWLARRRPGEIHLVATGPLTNVALALAIEPALPALIREVTVMGGAATAPGNVTPVAEANIWCDPVAAQAVLAAPWPITLVPLDVTMRTLLDEHHLNRLAGGGGIARYVAAILPAYFDYFAAYAFGGARRCCMHDVVAVAVAAGTVKTAKAPRVAVTVDTSDGPGRGQTVCDMRGVYAGFPEQPGAHTRVVLDPLPGFADELVSVLCAAGDAAPGTGLGQP